MKKSNNKHLETRNQNAIGTRKRERANIEKSI